MNAADLIAVVALAVAAAGQGAVLLRYGRRERRLGAILKGLERVTG